MIDIDLLESLEFGFKKILQTIYKNHSSGKEGIDHRFSSSHSTGPST